MPSPGVTAATFVQAARAEERGSRLAPTAATLQSEKMTSTSSQHERESGRPSGRFGEQFLEHLSRALWLGGGMLGLVVLLAFLVPAGPLALDRSWSEAMRHLETPLLTHTALAFNWLGRGIGRALELTIIGLLLLRRRRWLALAAFAAAETAAPLLSTLLKALVDRPRPPTGLVHALGTSFPSGHATYAGTTCVALVLVFTTPGPRREGWWLLASLGIVGMAWSRTYLQVHWLTDVIAGALLGSGVSLVVFAIAQGQVAGTLRGRHRLAQSISRRPTISERYRPLLRRSCVRAANTTAPGTAIHNCWIPARRSSRPRSAS